MTRNTIITIRIAGHRVRLRELENGQWRWSIQDGACTEERGRAPSVASAELFALLTLETHLEEGLAEVVARRAELEGANDAPHPRNTDAVALEYLQSMGGGEDVDG